MHSQDVLSFIKRNRKATINDIINNFPNASTDVITMAVYKYLKERRS